MASRPAVVVFDVNETLSNMEPLRGRFVEVGAPAHLLEPWFAGILRDGFGLTSAGAYAEFSALAAESLRINFARIEGLNRGIDDAVEHVLSGFRELDVHPDVPEGMRKLHEAGVQMVTLTNGSVEISEGTLARAGVLELLEHRISVGEVGAWKPAPKPYRYAADRCGVEPNEMALVAVHPWDTDGAKRAGLSAGWINRKDVAYPDYYLEPDATGSDLVAVATSLLSLGP
jgi:2-haloacid dehalogenase